MEYKDVALWPETYDKLWTLKTSKRKTMNDVIEFLISQHKRIQDLIREGKISE